MTDPGGSMKRKKPIKKFVVGGLSLVLSIIWTSPGGSGILSGEEFREMIKLPQPRYDGKISVEKVLLERRSVRHYTNEPLSLSEISQLLWAAQGITDPRGFRTAPSAGARYPLEVYMVVGKVRTLSAGIYKYNPYKHELVKTAEGDKRSDLCRAALNQGAIRNAPAVMVFGCVYERTTVKYGNRGIQYVFMEAGHAAQNVFLQAVSLGLGAVVMGAFNDHEAKKVLNLEADENLIYIMPIGRPPAVK